MRVANKQFAGAISHVRSCRVAGILDPYLRDPQTQAASYRRLSPTVAQASQRPL